MFKSYLLITLRNLKRDISYSLINIVGLAVGITCFLLLALYVESELSYDRHFDNYEQIYRVVDQLIASDSITNRAPSSRELAPAWARDYAEIKESVRFSSLSFDAEALITYEDIKLYWKSIMYADENVFSVFSHNIIAGDPVSALHNPNSIALSESMARAYFGDANPLGKSLKTDQGVFNVTLVFADLPRNTHLTYDALISHHFIDEQFVNVPQNARWWGLHCFGYVVIPEPLAPGRDKEIGREIFEKYMGEIGRRLQRERLSYLEPLADIHLNSVATIDRPKGSMFYIITFSAIGFFVLLVAAINYMNLATARATKRAREVGIRRILGVERSQLIVQFLAESLVFALIATLLALFLVYFCLNFTSVDQLLGGGLALNFIERPDLIVLLIIFTLIVGIGSGLYPAFYLSSIGPKAALESNNRSGSGGKRGFLRQVLVFFQFVISVGVIACILLMAKQMQFIHDRPLGFDDKNIILITLRGGQASSQIPVIKNELMRNSSIVSISATFSVPGVSRVGFFSPQIEDNNGTFNSQTVASFSYGVDYLDHLGIKIVTGRGFDAATVSPQAVLVNQAMVDTMGWEQPIGKQINQAGNISRVIGVTENYHYESLHQPIQPIFIQAMDPGQFPADEPGIVTRLSVRTSGEDIPGVLAFLEEKFREYDPNHPFEYEFFDQALAQQYETETRHMKLIGIFAALCILISCLGLYGLSAYTTAQRTKEIGIRRIMGASVTGVILMLFSNIFRIVMVASVVASILSFIVINDWLSNFAYRDDINLFIFIVATMGCVVIAFGTIALQSYKGIMANPVESLRSE